MAHSSTQTFTQGSIRRALVTLSLPLLLGNILQQLYNTVDAWVIGRFAGTAEFAAIGVAGTLLNLFLFAIVGGCVGISVVFSQLYGGGDEAGLRQEHFLALCLGLGATGLLAAAGLAGLPWLLELLRTPAALRGPAADYLRIALAGLPAAYLYNLYSALFRALGNARWPLMILAGSVGGNLGLDLLFVGRLSWGMAGAAAATVTAQVLAALACLLCLRRGLKDLCFGRKDMVFSKGLLRKTLSLAAVSACHQTGLYAGKFLVQGAVNTAGTDVIAAYTATTRIEGFVNSFGDSGAAATAVVAGQNHGAGRRDRVRRTFWESLLLLALLGLASSAVLFTTASAAMAWMLGDDQGPACRQAVAYLRVVALFYLLCFTGNTFAGLFDGCGRPGLTFLGAATHIALRVVLSWLWVGRWGLPAVAVATGLGWVYVNLLWTPLARRLLKGETS